MTFQLSKQHTLNHSVSFVGIGLHSGVKSSITIRPCDDGSGITFVRKDIRAQLGTITARWFNVVDSSLSTVIGNQYGVTVATIEHLLAALYACGVDNAVIDIDGPEVPIMDGSATHFIKRIENVGLRSTKNVRSVIKIKRPIEVRDGDKHVLFLPDNQSKYTVSIDFPNTLIGRQTYSSILGTDEFKREIAAARTFGFKDQIDDLKQQGLILGGSLKNAILIDGEKVVNEEGLRYEDEFVRHKLLDAVGDLALSGVPIVGHYYGHKPGHGINRKLLQKIFEDQSAWDYMLMDDLNNLQGTIPSYGTMRHSEFEKNQGNTLQIVGRR